MRVQIYINKKVRRLMEELFGKALSGSEILDYALLCGDKLSLGKKILELQKFNENE